MNNKKDINTNEEKNIKKSKKKKKSVVRIIIRLMLFIILTAIVIYGIYFARNYYKHKSVIEEGQVVYDPLSATALGIDPDKLKEVGRINILVLGESNANQNQKEPPYYLTDTIMILSYNPQTQQASILSIPRDSYVGKKDKNSATPNYLMSYKMNAVYRNRTNVKETLECVSKVTGIDLDKCIMVDTDAIVDIVDAIGGVYFDVPIDMDYEDGNQELYIHLKAGEQLIDGKKAEQLLRFRHNQDGSSYPAEYGDNDIGRMRTQREFIQETAKQLLKIENATKVVSLLDIISKNVRTENLDFNDLKYYIPYLFKFNTSDIITDVLPGTSEQCNGVWIYTVDKTKTKVVVQDLFTDKVFDEEQNIEDNNIANQVKNEIVNTTVSNEEKGVTIELLKATSNDETFKELKEKLKQQGYIISKSGTTTQTEKTTIINRTNKSQGISKELKNVLGVGTILTGSDNAKVDYTVIVGEDYK